MHIPIPSNRKALVIALTIQVKRPCMLAIRVWNPLQPYSYYLRRKVRFTKEQLREPFSSKRNLSIPLPVSSEKLMLGIFDKKDLGSSSFKILDFKVTPFAQKPIWASPQQDRFMDFAIKFAQKAGYVNPGFYDSPNHEFLFQYMPTITDAYGIEQVTPARTHRLMPRVQISRRLFLNFTIPVRVAILAHEGCHYFLNTRSEKEADLCGIKYYLDYGFPTIEAIYAATKVFMTHPQSIGKMHTLRARDIITFINQYKSSS